ncbi:hypothetical protein BDP27DRAFT_1421242 [Rhodocollybia butyracea]|uniref:Aminoglycoside phosphotransferase domain-containing protein n=1 Tax=Rhodocollybia butyracea TaxID=206335 RepID=A0A9P5PSM7_9AGAR|nr:hypothetical protein BDP27DRAFT_1421242 [Rhodocollybia butyracea]
MADISAVRQDSIRLEIARLRSKQVVELKQVDLYPVFDVLLEGGEHVIARFECDVTADDQLTRRMFERATVHEALRDIDGVTVPRIYHVQPDPSAVGLPWMLMERIPGHRVESIAPHWKNLGVREDNMKTFQKQLATSYVHIFDTPIPDSLSKMFEEEYQHHHKDPMPAAFDIKLQYDSPTLESIDPAVIRARDLRQETATFLAHRFWHLMHDGQYSAEGIVLSYPEMPVLELELPILHKLKALVPALIPSVEEYLLDDGLLGSKSLHHYDPSVTNIMVDPVTAQLTGIIDWENTLAVPALLSATYPEWIRYDGEETPMSTWSSYLLQLSPDKFEYGEWRDRYDEDVRRLSPNFFKALRAGRNLKEIWDWTEKARVGRPLDRRFAAIDAWANQKASELGVDLQVPIRRKKDWLEGRV